MINNNRKKKLKINLKSKTSLYNIQNSQEAASYFLNIVNNCDL